MEFRVRLNELDRFARQFWEIVQPNTIFAFHGLMGAGKTTIINALCRAKGVEDATASPTFSIINEYIYHENGKEGKIFHMDLYRLRDEAEVREAGVEDCLYSGDICLVEWPEKAIHLFDSAVHIFIETVAENERSIRIKLPPR